MKFKSIFLTLILIVLSANFAIGQSTDFKVTKSEIFKDKNTNSDLVFSASDDKGGLVLLRHLYSKLGMNSRGYILEYYDQNLKLVKQKEFEEKKSGIKGMFVKDNTVNLIECIVNKSEETIEYNVIKGSLSDFNFSKDNIFSIGKDNVRSPFAIGVGLFFFSNFSQIDHDPYGEVRISATGKYIAFNFDIKNKKQETHRVLVYDNQLNKVYEQEFSENIKDKYFKYNSFEVSDEDGTVYFLGKAYKNESFKDRVDDQINYTYKLYSINNSGVNSKSFDTNDTYINSLEVLLNQKGLFCIGMYSEKNSDDFRGFAYYKLDKEELSVQKTKMTPFSEQFMIDKYGEKKGKKKSDKKKEISNVVYRDFFISDNNEIYFNAEEFYITTHTTFGPNGQTSTRTIYHYNDIYSCKFNFEGDMIWMRTINKGQATSGLIDYLSFTSGVKNGKMYIFLNGDDDVKKLKDNRIAFAQASIKKMNLYVIEIEPNGDFNYKILISDKDSKVTYRTNGGLFSNKFSAIFLEGNKGRDKRIAKIEL